MSAHREESTSGRRHSTRSSDDRERGVRATGAGDCSISYGGQFEAHGTLVTKSYCECHLLRPLALARYPKAQDDLVLALL